MRYSSWPIALLGYLSLGAIGFAVAAGNENESACSHSPARGVQAVTACATSETLRLSGTSMASPHVAGAMALCAERLGSDDPTTLFDCVIDSATPGVVRDLPGSPDRLLYVGPE